MICRIRSSKRHLKRPATAFNSLSAGLFFDFISHGPRPLSVDHLSDREIHIFHILRDPLGIRIQVTTFITYLSHFFSDPSWIGQSDLIKMFFTFWHIFHSDRIDPHLHVQDLFFLFSQNIIGKYCKNPLLRTDPLTVIWMDDRQRRHRSHAYRNAIGIYP